MTLTNFNADSMASGNKFFLAAHNTFTYLPIRKWYMKILAFACRCQSLTVQEQYNAGVRIFDLRIDMDGNTPRICHGLCEFSGDPIELLKPIDKPNVYIRVINERNKNLEKYKNYVFDKLIPSMKNIKFLVLDDKKTMRPIKDSRYPDGIQSYPTATNYTCYWNANATGLSIGKLNISKFPNPENFAKKYNNFYCGEIQKYVNNNTKNTSFWLDFIGKYNLLK